MTDKEKREYVIGHLSSEAEMLADQAEEIHGVVAENERILGVISEAPRADEISKSVENLKANTESYRKQEKLLRERAKMVSGLVKEMEADLGGPAVRALVVFFEVHNMIVESPKKDESHADAAD